MPVKSLAAQPDIKNKVLAEEKGFRRLGSTQTQKETEATPEIEVLARALWYDAATIYDYVRNHIDYVPAYGIRNGATGCFLAGRGGDWDQVALLVSLLRVSGYNTRFRTGQVVYNIDDLKEWLGVDTWECKHARPGNGRGCAHWIGDGRREFLEECEGTGLLPDDGGQSKR
jgi:transglutaminase-like putative cysteine protease